LVTLLLTLNHSHVFCEFRNFWHLLICPVFKLMKLHFRQTERFWQTLTTYVLIRLLSNFKSRPKLFVCPCGKNLRLK
jgi:hypothetical protein